MRLFHDVSAVYLRRDPVDFRKAINGLVLIIEQEMELSPFARALFVFCSRGRDKLKIVYWDDTGFCMWYKWLGEAKFKWPRRATDTAVMFGEEQLHWLLRGYNVTKMVPHQPLRYTNV